MKHVFVGSVNIVRQITSDPAGLFCHTLRVCTGETFPLQEDEKIIQPAAKLMFRIHRFNADVLYPSLRRDTGVFVGVVVVNARYCTLPPYSATHTHKGTWQLLT